MCENNENTVVPDDADEDIPFPGGPSSEDVSEGDGNRRKTIENVPKTQGIDPEKQHNWWIENLKNIAALGIVAFCLITIAVFAILQFVWHGNGDMVRTDHQIDQGSRSLHAKKPQRTNHSVYDRCRQMG